MTQDKDVGELAFRLKSLHYGVVLIRLNGYSSDDKALIITNAFLKYQFELINSFTVIQYNAVRIRK